jgi:hypothetical protein
MRIGAPHTRITTPTEPVAGVGRLPDLAHAALAEEGGDVVVPEAGAGTEGHNLLRISRLYLWGGQIPGGYEPP